MPPAPTSNPSDPPLAAYSLVSWVRRGLASQVSGATLPLYVALNGAAVPVPPVRLLGPGDITSLDPRVVIRTDPADGADAFEPNYLAMVELAWPDLPWMFSPSAPHGGRLQPWICLVVVPETDGVSFSRVPGGLSVLHLGSPLDPATELPGLSQIDLWTHAQAVGDGLQGDALNAALNGNSSARLARLISPRKLEAGKAYQACVVPTYRAGVNAALGLPVVDGDVAPAWDDHTRAPFSLPVFYSFRFQTGPGGDFASLARRIEPPKTPLEAGTRPMDASQPGFGLGPWPNLVLGLEGALQALDKPPTPWPAGMQKVCADQLSQALNPAVVSSGPVLTPPVYGHAQTRLPLPAENAAPAWLRDLNVDPRTRAAAAAGTQVIQREQEALLASAWTQWGDIRKANGLLRQAQLARQVSASLSQRHLQTVAGDGTLLQMTAPVHARVQMALGGVTATLRGHTTASRLPAPAVSSALRRLVRPRGPVGRQLSTTAKPQLVERLNLPATGAPSALVVAGPWQAPRGMVTLDDVPSTIPGVKSAGMTANAIRAGAGWKLTASTTPPPHAPPPRTPLPPLVDWSQSADVPDLFKTAHANLPSPLAFPPDQTGLTRMKENFRGAAALMSGYVNVPPAATVEPLPLGGPSGTLADVRSQLLEKLRPANTIRARVGARVPLNAGPDPLQPLRAAPQFPQPMYRALAELSPEWMLPGVSQVPPDAAALLQTNPRFIEAFMVGLNEEFARELLWREFPGDRGATFFQNFWGAKVNRVTQADIPPVASFDANVPLGGHVASHATTGSLLVLLIRAELFRRYPSAVVSAVPAQWSSDGRVRQLGPDRRPPVFRGQMSTDITFFGFDVSDPRGSDLPADGRPGCYFLIEEHATEPRFGLEPEPSVTPDGTWNELSWPEVTTASHFLDPTAAPATPSREGVTWGSDAASMAHILLRRPVRIALHGRALLGGETP